LIGLSNPLQRPFTSLLWRRKERRRADVKMSQAMTLSLRLQIIISLKKHTIFIVATLSKPGNVGN
jgi:hypothetical protein